MKANKTNSLWESLEKVRAMKTLHQNVLGENRLEEIHAELFFQL